MLSRQNIKKINDYLWEIPKSFRSDMLVPVRIYSSEKMLDDILLDKSLEQAVNVAALPGIQKYSLVMPDAHWGYGFPVGGVAATIYPDGVISPGGIGFDINCGVRLLASEKIFREIEPKLEDLSSAIYKEVPSGVGRGGRLKLNDRDLDLVLKKGAGRMVELDYGRPEDLEFQESGGSLSDADPSEVSAHAKNRGRDQLGTMGAGNHFVEVERVEKIYDKEAARTLGLFPNQVTVLIHTGSRGLGHQIATDYIREMLKSMPRYGIKLPDRQLACVPFSAPEGKRYFGAMSAAANFAWANRELITWEIRKAWQDVLGNGGGELKVVYDVSHNIAKIEEHQTQTDADYAQNCADNFPRKSALIVHRKGATRSFPGQPVLIPGSMGTGSYVLLGQEKSLSESFGSTCHGAGRRMSRSEAKRKIRGSELKDELLKQGVAVCAGSLSGLAEEAPEAYKDVDEVVEVVEKAGLAKKVARLKPIAVIKG